MDIKAELGTVPTVEDCETIANIVKTMYGFTATFRETREDDGYIGTGYVVEDVIPYTEVDGVRNFVKGIVCGMRIK